MNKIDYLKLCHKQLKDLHQKESISLVYLWLDYIYAFLFHGCLIKQYTGGGFYKIKRFKMKEVMTQKRLDSIIDKYNRWSQIPQLANKGSFNALFSPWVHRKWLLSKDLAKETFEEFVRTNKIIFVKPLDAQEGIGIKSYRNLDEREADLLYNDIKDRNYIIEEAITQHEGMFFGNHSVNTIRIITCVDTKRNTHILKAALRAGRGDSVVDNFSAGGVLYNIDVETGIIDSKGICNNGLSYLYHPGTDTCMLGYKIPMWESVLETVKEAAKVLEKCRFIGWDVAITKTGVELIEGNHNPGLFTLESVGEPYTYFKALNYLEM